MEPFWAPSCICAYNTWINLSHCVNPIEPFPDYFIIAVIVPISIKYIIKRELQPKTLESNKTPILSTTYDLVQLQYRPSQVYFYFTALPIKRPRTPALLFRKGHKIKTYIIPTNAIYKNTILQTKSEIAP